MAAFKPVGPAKVRLGNPITGGAMTLVTDVESVEIDLGLRSAYTSNAGLNGTPIVDGQYVLAPQPVARITVADASIEQLNLLLLGESITTASAVSAIGFGSSFKSISAANVPTVNILADQQEADEEDAANALWFPGGIISGLEGINFGRVDEGEIQQFYSFEIRAVYRDEDQTSPTPVAIPASARIAFMGDPAAFGLTWVF